MAKVLLALLSTAAYWERKTQSPLVEDVDILDPQPPPSGPTPEQQAEWDRRNNSNAKQEREIEIAKAKKLAEDAEKLIPKRSFIEDKYGSSEDKS